MVVNQRYRAAFGIENGSCIKATVIGFQSDNIEQPSNAKLYNLQPLHIQMSLPHPCMMFEDGFF
jgi:hypothetical protein